MIFPDFLKPGDTIGVTAPSGGVTKEPDKKRFMAAKQRLTSMGYQVIFTQDVFKSDDKGRSDEAEVRAREFMELITNPKVKYICSAKGGDFLMEVLPYLDFKIIKNNPKWIQGFSDNTLLTFNICTTCHMATAYCNNFGDYGMEVWDKSVKENFDIITGKLNTQRNFEFYENKFYDRVTGLEGYHKDLPVSLKLYNGDENQTTFSGRIIGGCLDSIMDMAGTKYENVLEFIESYKEDGIIWYFESFLNNSEGVVRNMWKLQELGWFKYLKGVVFGREMFYENYTQTSFDEAAMVILDKYKVPVIFGADIGHKPPQMCMINGAKYTINYSNGKLNIFFEKKA